MNDPLYKIEKFLQEWDNRFTLHNPRLLERYVEAVLYFFVVFRLVGVLNDYVAVFVAIDYSGDDNAGHLNILSGFSSRTAKASSGVFADVDVTPRRGNSQQELVLIGDVKAMENPKVVIPSLVWLQPFDRFASGLTQTLCLTSVGTFESVGVVTDREGMRLRDLRTVVTSKVANQNIQGGSQVVDTVTEDQGNFCGNGLVHLQPTDVFPIGLSLGDDVYRLRLLVQESRNCISEIPEVLVGPVDFSPRSGRWAGHGG